MADLFNKDKPNEFVPTISVGEVLSLKALDAQINQISFSPHNDNYLASAQEDSFLTLFDVAAQRAIAVFNSHKANARGIAFSPTNRLHLLSVGLDKSIIIHDINIKS